MIMINSFVLVLNPRVVFIHFKSERRREHDAEENVVLSEEEAINQFQLAISIAQAIASRSRAFRE